MLVVEDVLGGATHVGVLGGVVDDVVVVPERPRPLDVRVAVVLVLPGPRDVGGVAVSYWGREAEPCRWTEAHGS